MAVALHLLWEEADASLATLVGFSLLFVLTASAVTALSPVILKLLVDRLDALGTSDGHPRVYRRSAVRL